MADFFNRVLDGLNKGVNSVSENSKLFVEKTKLGNSIRETESLKNKKAQQLGMIVYEMKMNGLIENEEINEICNEIEQFNKKIESLNNQLVNLQNKASSMNNTSSSNTVDTTDMKQCSCGYYNKKDALFCTGCGNKLIEPEPEIEEEVKGNVCSCGHINEEGSLFCIKCGSKLNEGE